ncbi:hypothetical protein [Ferruginibacter sp.]|uniref:hypothetical protein n=1 Tax=Ferruginibacter sp. TaxID=1940288 RepID=UPI002657B0A2|nr:hypothetical protein [Ferruginibacter sp.]
MSIYIKSKFIHDLQKIKWIDANISEKKFQLITNYEIEILILSYPESSKDQTIKAHWVNEIKIERNL